MAHILIVEDDPINAEIATIICQAGQHTVTVTRNGCQALVALDAEPFDLVLTDIIMPEMDGLALALTIRSSDTPYACVPIIAMTALGDEHHLHEMAAVGIDEVITKPFRNRALLALVNRVLSEDSFVMFRGTDLSYQEALEA